MPDFDDIVVGGGIAGMVAARRLALGGRRGALLEASDRLGGQVARHSVAGVELDAGAESFATRGDSVAFLLRVIGLGDDIVAPVDTPAWLYRSDGSAIALPATSLLGVPAVPLATDVIAAIGLRAALRAELDVLLPSLVGARATTFGELVRRRMGRGVLDGLVSPVVRGVHSISPDELPLDRAAPGLATAIMRDGSLSHAVAGIRERSAAGSQVAGIRGGMFRLADALEGELRRFGVEVRTGLGAVAETTGGAGGLRGRVLVAHPGAAAGRPISLVTLAVEQPELDAAPRGTGLLVASDAPGIRARALTHLSAKWSWLRDSSPGIHLLRLSYDGHGDAAELQAAAERDAATLLGVPLGRVVEADVVRWTRAVQGEHAVDGMEAIGEAVSGTGLAAVIAFAEARAGSLLNGSPTNEG